MIKWAGWLITFFGTAHTLGALTVMKAAGHAGTWFSGGLWRDDLAAMSPANSAFWLSAASFGVPLVLVGLTVLWLERRGITPPVFLAWALGIWTLLIAAVLLFTPWPILLVATALLFAGIRRGEPAPPRGATGPDHVVRGISRPDAA
ncbi:DUF6463 family protein [Amycolatopsis keratiniphila]|uniref:Uncharacterized protein n=1 Tax=Amycolatopsis keratiniphila TaxID=129921 RepID=R4T4N2_9PSEU|nr:DUF6463 family protein [Amycolatopsis keratiniphila]AGM07371.1 hypothetical protein AORI_4787 [Amycolatopsis keratiniphila]